MKKEKKIQLTFLSIIALCLILLSFVTIRTYSMQNYYHQKQLELDRTYAPNQEECEDADGYWLRYTNVEGFTDYKCFDNSEGNIKDETDKSNPDDE